MKAPGDGAGVSGHPRKDRRAQGRRAPESGTQGASGRGQAGAGRDGRARAGESPGRWSNITNPIEASTDALRKTNDELRITNDRLEHRDSGQSQLALELDEARIFADKLADAADKADDSVRKLFSEKSVGWVGSILSGQTRTAPVEKELQGQLDKIREAEDDNKNLTRQNPGDAAAIQQRREAIRKMYGEMYRTSDSTVRVLSGSDQADNLKGVIADYRGARTYAGSMLDQMSADDDNQTETKRNKKDQGDRDKQRLAEEAARKAKEASRQAMEAQRKSWEDEDNARKVSGNDSAKVEEEVWTKRLAALKKGSEQYTYALRHLAESTTQARSKQAEEEKQGAALYDSIQKSIWDEDYSNWLTAGKRSAQAEASYWESKAAEAEFGSRNYIYAEQKANEALRKTYAEREAIEAAQAKSRRSGDADQSRTDMASLEQRRQSGQISAHQYAQGVADVHTRDYDKESDALDQDAMRALIDMPDGATSSRASIEAQTAIDKSVNDRRIQINQDAANVVETTWEGAFSRAGAQWIQDAEDTATQVKQLFGQAIDGLNENLSSAMVGDKTNWSGYLKGLGKTVANDGLKHMEAPVLSALGLGKADGSSEGAALWVKVVGGDGSKGDEDGLVSALSDSGSSDSTNTGSAIGKGIAGVAQAFAGGFAVGGDVDAGSSFIAGEMGPELITARKPLSVIPNKDMGGGGNNNYFSFGQNVTREDVVATVQSMLGQHMPHLMSGSVHAVQDRQQRRPASAR